MAQTRLESAMPEMPVRNLTASIDFYSGVLGFRLEHLHGDEYAVMRRDGVRVGLMRATPAVPAGNGRLFAFVSAGIDELFDTVSHAAEVMGGRVTETLAARPYGYKDFTVVDPDGNRLAFGERL